MSTFAGTLTATFGELKRRARDRLDLHQRERPNRVLIAAVGIQLALFVIMAAIVPFESRLVSGQNLWFKPIKFTNSITVYLLTVAWLLDYLKISRWGKQIISWGVSFCVTAQIGCIVLQAARGTTSHFNRSTPFDTVVSLSMDVLDPLNSVFVIALLVFAFQAKYAVSRPTQWGITSGLLIFLGASAVGGVMVFLGAHSVGAVGGDSGPGLPFINWKTTGGDLRPAHFLGLHAFQILPIFGWLINRHTGWPMRVKLAGVTAAAIGLAAFITFLFVQAMSGTPLIRL